MSAKPTVILSETPPEFVRQWTCPTSHASPTPVSGEKVSRHGLSKMFQCRVQTCFDFLQIPHPPSPSSPCTGIFHIAIFQLYYVHDHNILFWYAS